MPSRTIYGDTHTNHKERKKLAKIIKKKTKKRSTTTALEFESLVQRNLGASAGMDFAGLALVLEWGCCRADRRLARLLEGARGAGREKRGGGKSEEEGGEQLFLAAADSAPRVLACLDASRAAAVASGLEEDLAGCETPPAFVCRAIEAAKGAAERALKAAASVEEALGLKTRETIKK